MESRTLEYYLGLTYTVEVSYDGSGYWGSIRELPNCGDAYVEKGGSVETLWQTLEDKKRRWFKEALREGEQIPEPPRLDYDSLGNLHEDEDVREMLYWSGARRFPIPLLQKLWLEELASTKLSEARTTHPTPKTASQNVPPTRALVGNVRSVPLGKTGKKAWLRFDGRRAEQGYRTVEVLDQPLLTEAATVAALTVLEATEVKKNVLNEKLRKLRKVLNGFRNLPTTGEEAPLHEVFAQLLPHRLKGEFLENLTHPEVRSLEYSLALLRYRRPGFDALPYDEQIDLFERHCRYINEFLRSSRLHTSFLEYGTARGVPTRSVERLKDQIEAAMLADVEDLSHLQIANRLGIFVPQRYEISMEIPEVKDLVRDGRAALKRALGKGGWRKRAEGIKEEQKRYFSLSAQDKEAERIAEESGQPVERIRALYEAGNDGVLGFLK